MLDCHYEAELHGYKRKEALQDKRDDLIIAKRSRTSLAIEKSIDICTAQLKLAIKCRTAFKHMPTTLVEAVYYFNAGGQMGDSSALEALESIFSDWSLRQHSLVLDVAIDRAVACDLERRRGHSFFGVGMATDESPPSGARFCAFRFQVTQLYIPLFPDSATWSDPQWRDTPPVRILQRLVDIVHCPGKDGGSLAKALQKQLWTLGLTLHDVHAGTGDGGGEMEGSSGVHSILERTNETYVRHRCLAHLSWRCADNGMLLMVGIPTVREFMKYLSEHGTWLRLQAIAVQPEHTGLAVPLAHG
jgi:hypothetical protein